MTLRLPDPAEKPWLTVAELAEITGEGEKAIRAALASGALPQLQIGRYKRIPTAALLRTLGMPNNSTEPAPASAGSAVIYALTKDNDHVQSAPDLAG